MDFYKNQQFHLFYLIQAFAQCFIHSLIIGSTFWADVHLNILTHPLLHDYRKRQQKNSEYDWQNSNSHIKNWQEIESLYYILSLSRSLEIRRINSPKIFKYLKPDSISLEYGCSLAPFYSTYKRYFSHKKSRWVLADLPNFPFHYAKYIYRNDPVKFHTINSDNFSNPLPEGIIYDFVVILNVF